MNPLPDSGIPNNPIFTEKAVNSSQQCILPQFTVPSNLGENQHKSNSQNQVLRTLYNDDLVPITVNDSKSDESHKASSHESKFTQAESIPSVHDVHNTIIQAHSSDVGAHSNAVDGDHNHTDAVNNDHNHTDRYC